MYNWAMHHLFEWCKFLTLQCVVMEDWPVLLDETALQMSDVAGADL